MFILGLSMCDDWWPHSKAPRSEKPVAASSREAKDLMKLAQRRWFVAENWRRLRDGMEKSRTYIYGWWFGTVFIFPYIGNNHPN